MPMFELQGWARFRGGILKLLVDLLGRLQFKVRQISISTALFIAACAAASVIDQVANWLWHPSGLVGP
jgi:hypothetical protein